MRRRETICGALLSGVLVGGACAATGPPADGPSGAAAGFAEPAASPADGPAGNAADPPSTRGSSADATPAEESALAEAFREVLRSAPLSVPRLNYFHSALEVPPMDTARTVPEGTVWARIRSSHSRSDKEGVEDGYENDFDGTFHEWLAVEGTWAPVEDLEIGARAVLAGWDEHQDRFDLFDEEGVPIVSEEKTLTSDSASKRHINLSVFGVRAKYRFVRREEDGWDLAVAPSLKIPFGRDRDLTHAGTWDPALTVLATYPVAWGTVHANLGGTWPMGDQNLFEPEADVDLDPFLHAGVGVVVPIDDAWSFAAQLEGNTSAFGDVPFLDEHPVEFVFGVRRTAGNLVLELALGTGLDHDAAYEILVHLGIGVRF